MTLRITQGDTYPTITIEVLKNNEPFILTGAVVYYYMQSITTGNTYREICTVYDNIIEFEFSLNSSLEAGIFKASFYVTLPTGETFAIPNEGYYDVVVKSAITPYGATGNPFIEGTGIARDYMLIAHYDGNSDGTVDEADIAWKLDDGAAGKSYADIHTELTVHTDIPDAHHTNVNDPTAHQKEALDAAHSPSTNNPFLTVVDISDFMLSSVYDANGDGVIDSIPWNNIQDIPSTYNPSNHVHPTTDITTFAGTVSTLINSDIEVGTNLTKSYNGVTGKLTLDVIPQARISTANVKSIIKEYVISGTGISTVYDAENDVLDINYDGEIYNDDSIKTVIGVALTGSNGITPVYDDFNKLTDIAYSITSATLEQIQDMINNFILAGAGISKVYSDGGNTLTIGYSGTLYTDNSIKNLINATIVEGTCIDAVYDPDAHTLTLAYSGHDYSELQLADVINNTIEGSNGIITEYDGDTGKLIISLDFTTPSDDIKDIVGGTVVAGTGVTIVYDNSYKTLTITLASHSHAISDITGLQDALNNKVETSVMTAYFNKNSNTLDNVLTGTTKIHFTPALKTKLDGIATGATVTPSDVFRKTVNTLDDISAGITNKQLTSAEKTKLAGIATGANNYVLPTASNIIKGGIQVGDRLSIINGVLSADLQDFGDMYTNEFVTGVTNVEHYVDTANSLLDGDEIKTYTDIHTELTDHESNPSAHHERYTDDEAVAAVKADTDIVNSLATKHSHTNKNVLDNIIDAGSGSIITNAERIKLTGVATGANNYNLPIASGNSLGGIKVGTGLSINGSTGVLSTNLPTSGDMLEADYASGETNLINVVDTANSLLFNTVVKTYVDINTEMETALSDHTAIATAHHTNVNDPSSGQKDALVGTSGTPSSINKYVTNADQRLSNSRNPNPHASHHKLGQDDVIKIDEFAPATDTSSSACNATVQVHGLCPKLSGDVTDALRGNGTWGPVSAGSSDRSFYLVDSNSVDRDVDYLLDYADSAVETHNAFKNPHQTKLDELYEPDDNTILDATTFRHGLLKKLTGSATVFMDGSGNWTTPTGVIPAPHANTFHTYFGSDPLALDLLGSPTDNTINNVNNFAHGLCPKGNANTNMALNGNCVWSVFLPGSFNGSTHQFLRGDNTWYIPEGTWAANFGITAGTICEGSDSRLTDSRTPKTHNDSHKAGQADPIPLDSLAPPTNSTLLDSNINAHGLLMKLSGSTSQFLNGSGEWTTPTTYVLDTFTRWDDGVLSTASAFMPHLAILPQTVSKLIAYVQSLPIGSNLIFDIRKNDPSQPANSIFTTLPNIPTTGINIGGVYQFDFTSTLAGETRILDAGDTLYIVIIQVGTIAPGTGLYIKAAF